MHGRLTIHLLPGMRRAITHSAKHQHMTISEYVRDALRRQFAVERFHAVRARVVPNAKAQGVHTDTDVAQFIA